MSCRAHSVGCLRAQTAAFKSFILQWLITETTITFLVSTQPEQLFKSKKKIENLFYDLLLFSQLSKWLASGMGLCFAVVHAVWPGGIYTIDRNIVSLCIRKFQLVSSYKLMVLKWIFIFGNTILWGSSKPTQRIFIILCCARHRKIGIQQQQQ